MHAKDVTYTRCQLGLTERKVRQNLEHVKVLEQSEWKYSCYMLYVSLSQLTACGVRGASGACVVERVTLVSDDEFADVTRHHLVAVDCTVTTLVTVLLTWSTVRWTTVRTCDLRGTTGVLGLPVPWRAQTAHQHARGHALSRLSVLETVVRPRNAFSVPVQVCRFVVLPRAVRVCP